MRQHDHGRGRLATGDIDLPLHELNGVAFGLELVGDQRFEIGGGHMLLAIGQLQEAQVRCLQLLVVQLDSELLQGVLESGPARMLADDQLGALPADILRIHDLVGRAVLEHAVLMDAGLVRERVRRRRSPC